MSGQEGHEMRCPVTLTGQRQISPARRAARPSPYLSEEGSKIQGRSIKVHT